MHSRRSGDEETTRKMQQKHRIMGKRQLGDILDARVIIVEKSQVGSLMFGFLGRVVSSY